ncbi:MAG: prevent-host-death protein [Spirochaetes bacterium GWF1_51_8]|nr:MAG: prevent-host-death protein [Spirochaetes bacterium GWF1_51_8]
MNPLQDIKPVSYIKTHTAEILKQINDNHRPVFITQNGEARAVLIDPETYNKSQEVEAILKILSRGETEIAEGRFSDTEKVFSKIEKEFGFEE